MADLEDFFAKRDKKKKKAGKFEADNVAKILEKKRVDMSKSSYQPPAESSDPVSEYKAQEDDDEWKEAVEEKPDFTGLKIQDLVEENSEDEENEAAAEAEAQKEVWNRTKPPQAEQVTTPTPVEPQVTVAPPSQAKEQQEVKEAREPEKVEQPPAPVAPPTTAKFVPPHLRNKVAAAASSTSTTPVPSAAAPPPKPVAPSGDSSGKYVPIHLRQQQGSSSSSSGYRPKKSAPNIDDRNYFPTLGEVKNTN